MPQNDSSDQCAWVLTEPFLPATGLASAPQPLPWSPLCPLLHAPPAKKGQGLGLWDNFCPTGNYLLVLLCVVSPAPEEYDIQHRDLMGKVAYAEILTLALMPSSSGTGDKEVLLGKGLGNFSRKLKPSCHTFVVQEVTKSTQPSPLRNSAPACGSLYLKTPLP